MKKEDTINEIFRMFLSIPIRMDSVLLSPLSNKNTEHDDFTQLNGTRELILILLLRYKKMTMSQLAEYLGTSNQRMTFPINCLVEKGLICREKNPLDKRISWVRLTEQGEHLTSSYMQATHRILQERFSTTLSDEQFATFLSLLVKNMHYMKLLADNISTDFDNN